MIDLNQIIVEFLKAAGLDEAFHFLGVRISTVGLIYVYTICALISGVYVIISTLVGEVLDFLDVGDGNGMVPAVAIGTLIFSSVGGLSLFFTQTTPLGSIGYGFTGGIVTFAFALFVMRWLSKNQSNDIVTTDSLLGETGTVHERINNGPGVVKMIHNGKGEYFRAYSGQVIGSGELVRITNVRSSREVDVEKV
ncbi:MAG: hypothetical protein UT66_C0013G0009 [candidate division CPR2 bacterium GW2011_GWC1_39_9]|uniref:Uncharacterized protein n=1 Tax=candidate division CPR2 bacterium GW2011_GWC2_39_10 TaxID=1618345 RepID=A0A0G0P7V0_UNCC2|nr:MAG: hypothetical protein UT18_C0012G0031 [candidate division CPR2 bacterium GW2011_GWC2_39_10]KKR35037.1 MAG: hypothetical protein UT66_C0013G0009 [candidate division CPR2 bacterium GW2011_GWC1_39_9]